MHYTVSSRGRPIGVTDLGFVRIDGPGRSGWFHPNTDGARLMPAIASPLPAMRAFLHRHAVGPDGVPLVRPPRRTSTLFADLAEALHHATALELTLHRPDGSLVPTETVGIQDTERLPAPAPWDDPTDDVVDLAPGAALTFADDGAPAFPRYQIHLVLTDAAAIP